MLSGPHEPGARELRYFGILLASALGLLGSLLRFKRDAPMAAGVLWGAALLLAVVYYSLPPVRRPVYLAWRAAFRPLQRIVSLASLAIVYYLVFTPLALLLRLAGRDHLARHLDRSSMSYFVAHRPRADSADYFQQF